MNWISVLAVAVGAALGALLRWILGGWLNPVWSLVPLGTLAANLIGGYLIGAALAIFQINVELAPELRLFVITGFLGGLTTFSSFSAETVTLLRGAHYGPAVLEIALHVTGSLLMTGLGIWTVIRRAR